MSYQTLIDALEAHGCKVNLTSGMAQCPAHDDRDPSLAVTERAGTVLIKCHAGCDTDRVLDALNLTWPEVLADSMPGSANERPRRSATGRARQTDYGECLMPIPGDAPRAPDRLLLRDGIMPSRSWKYRDAAGQVLYGVLRWDLTQFGGAFYNTWSDVETFFAAYPNHRVLVRSWRCWGERGCHSAENNDSPCERGI